MNDINKPIEYKCDICGSYENEVGELVSVRMRTGVDYQICHHCLNSLQDVGVSDKMGVANVIDYELENRLLVKSNNELEKRIESLLRVVEKLVE